MRPATTIVLAVLLLALFGAAIFQFTRDDFNGGSSKTRPPVTSTKAPTTTTP
jgi:hypothetical protein